MMLQISSLIPVTDHKTQSISGGLRRWSLAIVLGTVSGLSSAGISYAADKITFVYGPVRQSLAVKSLSNFVATGTVDSQLASYLRLAKSDTPKAKAALKTALSKPLDVGPAELSHILESKMGDTLLSNFGNYIQIQGGENSKTALRSGMVVAASAPGGLTLLSFLEKIPANLQIDIQKNLALAKVGSRVARATEQGIDEITKLSATEATQEPTVDFASLPDLRKPGSFTPISYRLDLTDTSRNRKFQVIVHRPKTFPQGKIPVLVMSHGLGADPSYYAARAQHFASHGYVVAVPEHPGSGTTQAQKFLAGDSKDYFLVSEFIDRPKDISYVLDELGRQNTSAFAGKLNLSAVGVLGHSFGGYTALALAGATIDFANLAKDCQQQYAFLNLSLLLQCQALQLPSQTYDFRDARVKAVIATNPVSSAVFGPKGLANINIPILIFGGGYDPATPFVFEQLQTFNRLTASSKYLALVPSQTHVDISSMDAGLSRLIGSIPNLKLAKKELLGSYGNAEALAFIGAALQNDPGYSSYMKSPANYASYLSQTQPNESRLYVISSASQGAINEAVAQFRQTEGIGEADLLSSLRSILPQS
jgi:predicted dienelactone hydrolase